MKLRKFNGKLIYGLPLWYKIIALIAAITIVCGTLFDTETNLLIIILFLLSLFTAFYNDVWICDNSNKKITHRVGLFFIPKKTEISFADLTKLRFDVFAKGKIDQSESIPLDKMPYGSQIRLILDSKNGDSFMIDSVSTKQKATIVLNAQELSAYLDIPLEE